MMIMQYARDEACTSHLAFFSYLTDLSNYLKLNKCFLCSLPASTSSSPPHLLLLPAHCTRKTLWVREVLVDARWTRHLQQTLSSNAITHFTEIWTLLEHILPNADVPDLVTWKLDGWWILFGCIRVRNSVRRCNLLQFSVPGREIRFQIFSWLAVRGKCDRR
jgi:hypothetical protein